MKRFVIAAVAAAGLLVSAGAAQAACSYDIAAGLNAKGQGIPYPGAEGRSWFVNAQPVTLGPVQYEKYGLPRELGPMDLPLLERAGVFSGVMVFAEKGADLEVIYVPVNAAACTFQPYQKKHQH